MFNFLHQNNTRLNLLFLEDKKNRHIGIAYTVTGWFLVALSSIFFTQTRATHSIINTCFHHYLAAFMTISLWASFKHKKQFFCKNPFLLLINSVICMACYYIYFMFKMAPAGISNSFLLNIDVLILPLMLVFIFKQKISFLSWLGLLISFAGVLSFYHFDTDFLTLKGVLDALMCLSVASLFVTMILLTKYLLKSNSPFIIALSHTLVGLFFSGSLLYFTGWQLSSHFELFCMGFDGFIYGLSLYFFITALKYTETYITTALSHFLLVFLVLVNFSVGYAGFDRFTVVGTLLIVVGLFLVPIPVYLEELHLKLVKK